jgi:WD40 repeat protein
VGAHGSLFIHDGTQTVSGKLGDEFFKAVTFYGDDDSRIVCLARHTLSLVNVENRTTIARLLGSTTTTPGKLKKSINCVATHPTQSYVAVGTLAGWVEMWDLEREEKMMDLKVGGQLIESLEFSPDGYTVAVGQSNRGVSLLDARVMEVVDRFEKQRSRVLSVSFSPEGDRIVAVSEDKTVVVVPLEIKDGS